MEQERICFTKEESFTVQPKEEVEEEEDIDPPDFFKEDRGPADTVNAGRVYCYSSEDEDEDDEESKPWSERLRRRPRCVRIVSPVIRDRLDLGTFTPMMTSEPRLSSMMASCERQRTMTMPSIRLLDHSGSSGLMQSLKRGHGENWEGRVAKKRGKHVKQVEVEKVVGGSREVEKRRRRASSGEEEERRVFRRRRRRSSEDDERGVLKRERRGGSDYGSLSSLDSDMLKWAIINISSLSCHDFSLQLRQ